MSKLLRATALVSSLLALSVVAKAADLGVRPLPPQPPVPYVPPFSWTGFYVGGNIGGAWSQGTVTDSFNNLTFSNGSNGAFIGGGQIGGNYQINNFVAGLEWDFDWAANSNNTSAGIPVAGTVLQVASNNRRITTLAARFGVAANNWLFYGKGGGGWAGNNLTVTNVPTGFSVTGSNNSNGGWLVGAGVEWAFAPHWSAKAEYDFLGLNNSSFTIPATFPVAALAGDTLSTHNRDIQMVKVGVNYLFNWAPY